MVIEQCDKANGSTLLGDYLVARNVLATGCDNDSLSMRGDNSISKSCNNVLRIIRHAICSYINAMAATIGQDHSRFQQLCDSVFYEVAKAESIGKVCSLISTAKSVQAKRTSQVFKMVDPKSGTVVVEGHVVPKAIWSTSIAKCHQQFVAVLEAFFPNNNLLHAVLNTSHAIALGKDAQTTLITTPSGFFKLSTLVPTFPENASTCQRMLNEAVAFMRIAQAYFSSGESNSSTCNT